MKWKNTLLRLLTLFSVSTLTAHCGHASSPTAPETVPSTLSSQSSAAPVAPGGESALAAGGVAGRLSRWMPPPAPSAPSRACARAALADPAHVPAAGGTGAVIITAAPDCPWTATSVAPFVVFADPGVGRGGGRVRFSVATNSEHRPRSALIRVNDSELTIVQDEPVIAQPPGPGPGADSYLMIKSPSGDYIGGGQDWMVTRASARFSATILDAGQTVEVKIEPADGTWWYLDLSMPPGQVLHQGTFEGAHRYPFQSLSPGLDFSGAGRGCNQLTGRFVIQAVEVSNGALQRLRASFEQQCENIEPALRGEISLAAPFDSLPPAPGPAPTAPMPPGPHAPVLKFVSDAGDYIGGGTTQTYDATIAKFTSTFDAATQHLRVRVEPLSGFDFWWYLDVEMPEGQPFVPGIYKGATRYPFNSPIAPGLSFSGSGRGCNQLSAWFTIYDFALDTQNNVHRLRATFEQHCENLPPALRGDIWIDQ